MVWGGSAFKWQNEIARIYYNSDQPGSYFGPVQLYMVLKQKDPSCKLQNVINWLRNQETYNVHRSRKTKFVRRKLVRIRPYETLSADIVFLQDLAKFNSNYSYILTVRCLFSNYAWGFPLKRKTQTETGKALESLFELYDGDIFNLWVDDGVEFYLSELYDKYNINKYSVKSLLKACHIENFNRILENRIYKVLTANNTLRWLPHLDHIIKSYNMTPSKRLYNLSPSDAVKPSNVEYLRRKFQSERKNFEKIHKKKTDLKVDGLVYVVKPKTLFSRGYKPTFGDKVRKITKILPTTPVTFRISGLSRSYYREELAPTSKIEEKEDTVKKTGSYFVQKERVVGGRELRSKVKSGQVKEFLIKSYIDPEFEEWVDNKGLQKLKNEKLLCDTSIGVESTSLP